MESNFQVMYSVAYYLDWPIAFKFGKRHQPDLVPVELGLINSGLREAFLGYANEMLSADVLELLEPPPEVIRLDLSTAFLDFHDGQRLTGCLSLENHHVALFEVACFQVRQLPVYLHLSAGNEALLEQPYDVLEFLPLRIFGGFSFIHGWRQKSTTGDGFKSLGEYANTPP